MSASPTALAEAAAAISESKSIVLACHVNPDGDALGSLLSLALALKPLGKEVTCLSEDGVPDILRFLPGSDLIVRSTEAPAFDLALVVDSGELSRVGVQVGPMVSRARRAVNIDHHVVAGAFGDIRVLDSSAASTAEIVYDLLQALQAPLTPEIATCLFTGIITDTGSFRFQNVTPGTLRTAATLVEAGASPPHISENVFENKTYAGTRLLGHALSSLSQTADGRIVWAHITAADFRQLGAIDAETEGVVNYVRGVRGAEVGILFREMDNGRIRVSLRSRESVNVAEMAQEFGGGGHRMAAGCTLNIPLAEAELALVAVAKIAVSRLFPG